MFLINIYSIDIIYIYIYIHIIYTHDICTDYIVYLTLSMVACIYIYKVDIPLYYILYIIF